MKTVQIFAGFFAIAFLILGLYTVCAHPFHPVTNERVFWSSFAVGLVCCIVFVRSLPPRKIVQVLPHEENVYVLPEYWASALINGDYSGLSDDEEKQIQEWFNRVQPGDCVACSDEPYFSNRNDAGTLAGNVLEYTFLHYN